MLIRPRTWMPLLALGLALVACGGKNSGTGDAGGDGGPTIDASNPCGVFGATCTGGTQCCTGVCNNSGTCDVDPTMCSMPGSSCAAGTDCCTGSCVGHVCAATQCTSDNGACTTNDQCCGGACGANHTCTPLSATCKTSGNSCANSTDCCSGLCDAAGKCADSSYCVQEGDACAHDAECCGGICTPGAGALGTCTKPNTGSTLCSAGVDGTLCNGCGDCCSRLCAPYGATGVKICQPAEGCRINGDLCKTDGDCCGAAGTGLPGDGHVTCLREHPNDPVGICRNPQACNPEGDVCHYKNYNTCGNSSARNDCCGAVGNSGVCQLDALGVPRCYGLAACHQTGDTCAFSGDCCNGAPCIPDNTGALHCSAACSPKGGTCTSAADCCSGETCTMLPGSTQGTCGSSPTTCAQYGQACSAADPCCAGTACNVTGSSPVVACPAGQTTGCTCFQVIF
jgi:hypothetical protein